MNKLAQTVIVSSIMIFVSIIGTSKTHAKGIGECGELGTDCFSRGYIGISLGANTLDSDTLSASVSTFDDSDSTYGIIGGYRFNKFFGVEALANYFGKQNYYSGTTPISTTVFNAGVGANIYLPLGEIVLNPNINFVSVLVKIGINYWNVEALTDPTILSPIITTVYSNDGIDLFYGYGLNVDVAKYLTLRAEYTIFNLENDDTINNGSVKIIFKF